MSRILVLHPSDDGYGLDRVLVQVVQVLQEAGHDVTCWLPANASGNCWASRQLAQRSVRVQLQDLPVLTRRETSSVRGMSGLAVRTVRVAPGLAQAARRADLVYVNGLTLAPLAPLARAAGRPVLWHLHEIPPSGERLGRMVLALSSRQVCVSAAVARSFGMSSSRSCSVVHNAVPLGPRASSAPPRPLRVGIVARINAWKGHLVLAEAFAQLLAAGVDAELVVAGAAHPSDTATEQELRRRVAPLGDRVRLLGEVASGRAVMEELDVLVAPSTRPDPFPVSVLEGMSCGIPVVATRTGGHPEAVTDGVDGLLVPPGDPRALAAALRRLAEDPALRSRLGDAGRRRVAEEFTPGRFAAALGAAVDGALRAGAA